MPQSYLLFSCTRLENPKIHGELGGVFKKVLTLPQLWKKLTLVGVTQGLPNIIIARSNIIYLYNPKGGKIVLIGIFKNPGLNKVKFITSSIQSKIPRHTEKQENTIHIVKSNQLT